MNTLKSLVIFAISVAVFIVVIQQFIGISEVVLIILGANALLLAVACIVSFTGIAVWGMRWMLLFRKINLDVSWKDVYKYLFIGLTVSNVTPFVRFGGEPVRSYLASRKLSVGQDKTFATVGMDTFAQFISTLFISYLSIILLSFFNVPFWSTFFIFINIVILAMLLTFLFFSKRGNVEKLIYHVSRFISFFSKKHGRKFPWSMKKFLKNIKKMANDRKFLIKMLSLSLIERLLDIFSLFLIFFALGHPVSLVICMIGLGIAFIGGSIPLFPAGMVTFESFFILILEALGISRKVAAPGILLWRIFTLWFVIIIGLLISWYSGVKFITNKEVKR